MARRRRRALAPSTLPTLLPARWEPAAAWKLDRRCLTAREVSAALAQLWSDLGGVEALSAQQLVLCERAVFLRHQLVEHETAVLNGRPGTMEPGAHTQATNALLGLLKALGLERRARDALSLREYLALAPETAQAGRSDATPEGNS